MTTTKNAIDMAVGSQLPAREFGPLTTSMFVRYSGASGDLNPMHYDKDFAMAAGQPSVFSQGMHQAALLSTYATDLFGARGLRRYQVRFRNVVWPNDVLICTGEVTELTETEEGRLCKVSLVCTRQTGDVAIAAEADFLLS